MKERPILFSAPMIRALLAGTKTQTRRLVKLPTWLVADLSCAWADKAFGVTPCLQVPYLSGGEELVERVRNPWGWPDADPVRLWVRETWAAPGSVPRSDDPVKPGMRIVYRADDEDAAHTWRPSIFMPRWASRITLEVTDVRVDRLQDITEEDAVAEGVEASFYSETWTCVRDDGSTCSTFVEPDADKRAAMRIEFVKHCPSRQMSSAREAYMRLWHQINGVSGPKSWDANPWVWAISFKRVDHAAVTAHAVTTPTQGATP